MTISGRQSSRLIRMRSSRGPSHGRYGKHGRPFLERIVLAVQGQNKLMIRCSGPSGSEVNENEFPGFEDHDSDNVVHLSQASGFEGYSSGNNGKQASINKSGGSQKRKHGGADAALMEFLSNLHDETNARLEVISSRIDYEFNLGKAKQDVFDKLKIVEGLTLDQRYELCNILSDKPQQLEVFMGMRAGARLGYLLKLIEENQKVM
ncbi:uncharacterized protein LOC121755704 [Salvia splendens]|uniref:uncharacterized protein LOC121755704 n=1 Tax=Salvia splendens TaxID=180675 RepID=UPI001C27FCCC|nr:uncharacterized protein LOC121755704 [Salvia splendens]XP_042007000.1 uncharacterized protein LOC121755704 [Salvia splendens]XP_042007001.1 uncharacterized protein LOC121755704 [Salvia splendens]XP_042007002.1 uncharacterized protein LOC121755704 [Salvia splendens]